ncbi:mitochondrial cardiolipin hydrolase-like [Drosophila bipectinata]|uniref:mitochondrial cardiolipin hydrolase-like n=1 Tax=Drosophila bipectinata TaxID=42026 RepID=UPI001C8AB460|nr:mitochondrial cardiolipin hydrolase-like [Drosophila bipectinata]
MVLGSELVCWIWRKIRKTPEPEPAPFELAIFNELGEDCITKHYHFDRLRVPKEKQDCGNPYCSSLQKQKILNRIDAAVYSVDVAIFAFTSVVMTNALQRALSRNACVRIITHAKAADSQPFKTLRHFGVQVRVPQNPLNSNALMHHKFFVVDAASRVMAVQKSRGFSHHRPFVTTFATGSINWTMEGFGGNRENCLISYDAENAEIFQAEFNRLWEISTDPLTIYEVEEVW